jgi:hypothetical protein
MLVLINSQMLITIEQVVLYKRNENHKKKIPKYSLFSIFYKKSIYSPGKCLCSFQQRRNYYNITGQISLYDQEF